MCAIMNGIAYHGIFRPSGATFLVFADYCRPSIRLAALAKLPVSISLRTIPSESARTVRLINRWKQSVDFESFQTLTLFDRATQRRRQAPLRLHFHGRTGQP